MKETEDIRENTEVKTGNKSDPSKPPVPQWLWKAAIWGSVVGGIADLFQLVGEFEQAFVVVLVIWWIKEKSSEWNQNR